MTYDPSDTRQVRQAEQRERLADVRAADDLAAIMDTVHGRRFLHGLLGLCDIRNDGYVPGERAAQRHQDYLAGRRSIGIELLGQLERHAGPQTETMMAEFRAAEAERRRQADEAGEELDDE